MIPPINYDSSEGEHWGRYNFAHMNSEITLDKWMQDPGTCWRRTPMRSRSGWWKQPGMFLIKRFIPTGQWEISNFYILSFYHINTFSLYIYILCSSIVDTVWITWYVPCICLSHLWSSLIFIDLWYHVPHLATQQLSAEFYSPSYLIAKYVTGW